MVWVLMGREGIGAGDIPAWDPELGLGADIDLELRY
jgi:hypothetical protein